MSWTDTHETADSVENAHQPKPTARNPDGEHSSASASETTTTTSSSVDDPLAMTQCPVCDGTEFVSKKLVYEEFGYTEAGEKTHHRHRVRAEFELTCRDCGRRFHELPTECRAFYSEVAVLREDLNAAVWRTIASWYARVREAFRQVAWPRS